MGTTSKIECRWCREVYSLMILKRDHGQQAPRCVHIRTMQRLRAAEWCEAGAYAAVLEMAGVVKRAPIYRWWNDPVYGDGEPDQFGWIKCVDRVRVEVSSYDPVCPQWAFDLAKRLTTDRQLARRLGYVQKKQMRLVKSWPIKANGKPDQHAGRPPEKVWDDVDLDKVMPIEVRAKIIRTAANNSLAREMITDDPEAAALILREVY